MKTPRILSTAQANSVFAWDNYEEWVSSWDNLEGFALTWDERDALKDMGGQYKAFNIPIDIFGSVQGGTADIVAKLNGEITQSWDNVSQEQRYFVEISDEQIALLGIGSINTLIVTITTSEGLRDIRAYIFFLAEDTITDAIFYVLRDGVPVGRLTQERDWLDHRVVGQHRYAIRGVDKYGNYVDSNEITVTTYVKHATLALAERPADYLELIVRLDGRPEKESEYKVSAIGTYYEGRTYQVFNVSQQRENSLYFTFTTRTRDEYNAFHELIKQGKTLIYRDLYDGRITGIIPDYSSDFKRRSQGEGNNYIVNISANIISSDFNEVINYD